MKKNQFDRRGVPVNFRKTCRIMKTYVIFTLFFTLFISNAVWGQVKTVTLNVKSESVSDVLIRIKDITGEQIIFNENQLEKVICQNISLKDVPVKDAIDAVLKGKGFSCEVIDGVYVIKRETEKQQVKALKITGKVTDSGKNPLPGVTVRIKNTNIGVATDMDGNYTITVAEGNEKPVLVFSFVGMNTQEITYAGKDIINVTLQDEASEIDEVVVTGMFTRKAESFTGAATTFKQEELKRAGNQNLLKSLKNLDPSFQIMENLEFGSDPNRTPEIQMRGQTSFPNLQGEYEGNPNQPLFILDGFETTIEKVYDLDMNRVASVTLLKDAAAKAIYGSKAGNGVVVIETIRPKSGQLMISYTGNLDIEVPDLTGYNLMNAAEKLAFEKERGMYFQGYWSASEKQKYEELYNALYDDVLNGVDTYWLSKPLRTGVGQKHSLTLEGGDERMRYQAGVSYNNVAGVMKKSDRNTLNINTTLSYTYKNMIFRNSLEYTRNWSANSPYGSFDEYTRLNPYWRPYDENGNPIVELGTIRQKVYYNPLYNATLNTKDESYYSEVRENFSMDWKMNEMFRATGSFAYTHYQNGSDVFYPASHTKFIEYNEEEMSDRKGSYTKTYGNRNAIQVNIGLNFNKTWGKHLVFANATWNISTNHNVTNSYMAEGFGNDHMDDISFAIQYAKDSKPSGSNSKTREIGIIGALNYLYDDRYLFDASIRESASSMYGADNRWGTFWSLGAGWNVHKESFLKDNGVITQLKLRASMGYTGTQNFDPFQARARYEYGDTYYDSSYGAQLLGLPNAALKWQRNMDYNVGMDLAVKRLLILRAEYYIQRTDDLLSDISIPLSMGFSSYKDNLGKIENRGYEFSVALTPWRNDKKSAWVTVNVSALHNENKIKEIHDIFKSHNDTENAAKDEIINSNSGTNEEYEERVEKYTKPSTLYYEGQSMTAIWGMKSLGIDPMTGEEWYLDKAGNRTQLWSSDQQVVIGDTQDKLRGTIGLSAGFKGFTLSMTCSYKFGGDIYNSTLISRVENVTLRDNLDKRILNSWRKVGDEAPYKAAKSYDGAINYTKPTSRFIQKNNELYISSINLGYDFFGHSWLSKVGLERLKLSFYMNELARFSTLKIERGTSYPFARNYSFSLQATF